MNNDTGSVIYLFKQTNGNMTEYAELLLPICMLRACYQLHWWL